MGKTIQRGGKREGAGRPTGATSTVSSTLVARLRSAIGVSQAELAVMLDVREKTVWRYEKESIIPRAGKTHDKLEQLARENTLTIDEVKELGAATL